MPKFNLDNSRYAQLFSSRDAAYVAKFIDATGLLGMNEAWWKTQFVKHGSMTPTDEEGVASFTVRALKSKASPMMDMRAPLGDSMPVDQEGFATYQGTIPDFIAPGIVEKATEREYRERVYAQFGNDADIVMAWSQKVLNQVQSANQTLTNLGAQLMSTGKMAYTYGRGIQSPLHKAEIPEKNFVKAGEKAWTDANCDVLAQMAKIESDARDEWSFDGAMVWQMPKDMFNNVILKNNAVRAWIADYCKVNYLPYTEGMPISSDIFAKAVALYPNLSRIELVEEKQYNLAAGAYDTVAVHGWKSNVAVLRPAGFAGEIFYTNAIDQLMHEKYGASTVQKNFTPLEGGIYTLINTTLNNGMYKEWHTDLIMSAIPALTEFPHHVIVDTATAE